MNSNKDRSTSNKPALVLVHGYFGGSPQWSAQLAAFSDDFNVITPDLPGFGLNNAIPSPESITGYAQYVLAELDARDIEQFYLLGHSMGGMIVQYLGANYSPRLHSLLLCDTASEMPTLEMWNDRIATAQDEGITGLLDGTLNRWFTAPFLNNEKEAVEKVAEMIRGTDTDGYIACASAVRDMSQTSILSNIEVPTIIIVGEDDPACTVDQSKVLEQHINGSELVVLKNAAHLSNIEQTEAFNTAMMEFLNKQ